MGRRLPDLFVEYGFENISLITNTSVIRSFENLQKIFQFNNYVTQAIANNKITEQEANTWLKNMKNAEQKGRFIYCVNFFTVVGKKPL